MLRVKGKAEAPPLQEPPVEEEVLPQEAPMEQPPIEEALPVPDAAPAGGVVDPAIAGYMGPEMGPFMCSNCQFFQNGSCAVVAGPIDPNGFCHIFTPLATNQPAEAPEDAGQPLPEDMPPQA